jgi:hypothetical protein
MYTIAGSNIRIAAHVVAKRPTRATNAWLGQYETVQLDADLKAIRVHVGAGEGAAVHKHLATGAGERGAWFAIGDFIHTYDEYKRSRALPADFTHIAECTLRAGSVLNVGRCAPLFRRGTGGGEQAEYVDGPAPLIRTLDATSWSRTAGHA